MASPLENVLLTNFTVEGTNLIEFFNTIKELDSKIKVIPLDSEFQIFAPAVESEAAFINDEANSLIYCSRGREKKRALKELFLEPLESQISKAEIDEIKTKKDFLIRKKKTDYFATPEAFLEAAKLVKLSGTALSIRSKFRDDYIASLLYQRMYVAEKKKKCGLTAVAIEENGVNRILAFRSGNFTAIPQEVLQQVFESLVETDDWGEIVCNNWYVDQHVSYANIEFPELAKKFKDLYPELPFEHIPGIRISTGSTGWNSLQVAMTWRNPDAETPAIVDTVSQKHCGTYDKAEFVNEVHQNTWEQYGELPARLADLFCKSVNKKNISSFVEKVYKELQLNKVFKQKDDDEPKSERGDYKKLISDLVVMQTAYLEDPTLYDVATSLMDAPLYIDFPASYQEELKSILIKAPFCKCFNE